MATTIPLSCNICPKKPKFSDVSHLLTHVASKGHLSNYYKVKVRAGGDPAARNAMDEYDRWYSEWRVEDLMSDRMNLKDKKKPRTRATGDIELHPFLNAALLTDLIKLLQEAPVLSMETEQEQQQAD
ncbi:hypothetical protein EG328_006645 [Venturia inaequalis]|uniref:Uncharacterized protein n=1 Tax=Venturia inaequalis TaxID=5025 RepID=A0A8H3UIJ7_VENIN|nr:hypothetical protein EG328_006645 [Venturia inaequalis]